MLLQPVLLLVAALTMVAPVSASEAPELAEGPRTLIVSYRAEAAKRTEFRRHMAGPFADRLATLRREGKLAAYEVYYSWYRQPDVWDAMAVLHFASYADVQQWLAVERSRPGGLDAAGLALGEPVATYSADLSWEKSQDDLDVGEVYYVIPYSFREAGEYRDYVAGYVLPQFDGWIREGALSGYQLYMNRYAVGAPWDSLFIQRYRDFQAFGKRQQVLDKVRVGLRESPEWMGWHKRKGDIRSETENSIAELIAH
ncbi:MULTISPECIES: hypothetical protein [unclassified Sphingopyxis]|uniref:hypothetical protein n=1 Tax=unclassified Sphingopyxis TaxID=2614943 RepID=UPI000737799B|nr:MULTISPECIES: hypothetical protein [unclassified Sphingopyxis]KTE38394.1 hypothetical protein ATE62_11270 [Sphingopyxis sp. HIX]KTE84180.1 hypothetical protein ATE72_10195 [Sphingopyxis sp. HXXIV]